MKKLFLLIGLIILSAQLTNAQKINGEIRTINEPFLKMMAKPGERVLFWGNKKYQYIKIVGRDGFTQQIEVAPRIRYTLLGYRVIPMRYFFMLEATYIKD
jgi:hypothetical protein